MQVCGPWTLAAMLEVPSGHRALTDSGAVDDLATSLAEGLAAHIADIAKRVPGAGIVVQIDEPSLPAVLTGNLPTASGFGTVPAVPAVRAIDVLSRITDALGEHPSIAHCCHAAAPLRLLRAAGIRRTVGGHDDPRQHRRPRSTRSARRSRPARSCSPARCRRSRQRNPRAPLKTWATPILQTWDRLGFPREQLARTVVPTPTCGLAGADREWALRAMKLTAELGQALQDLPEGW